MNELSQKKVVFVTGGARSGKSSFAQRMALSLSPRPVYLATAHIWDDDFKNRVERHRSDRGPEWETIEEEIHLSRPNLEGRVVVLDCVTLWLTNLYHANGYETDSALESARTEWKNLLQGNGTLIVVSNELGMGVHPENEAARKFADMQGWMNQTIAGDATEMYLMVSGQPLKIK